MTTRAVLALGLAALLAALAVLAGLGSPVPAHGQGGTVSIRSHDSARGVFVTHANALSVDASGTTITATVASIAHISSVTHVAAAGPLPVVVSTQQGRVAVDAHQAGTWNVAHITSTVHVVGTIQAGIDSGNLVCHSTAAFATSASGIVIHAAGASNRIFICGIVLAASAAAGISFVEGTGATCGTGTKALLGSTVAGSGMQFAIGGNLGVVAAFPWIATATAGNNLCLLLSAGRVSGTISYRGGP